MVASTENAPESSEQSPPPPGDPPPTEPHEEVDPHGRGGVRHLLTSASRLGMLQFRIIMTQLKLTAMGIAIALGLYLGAAVFGILAVIFLCVGVFHVLLIWLPVWLSYLIFGVTMALVAGLMILIATKRLTRKEEDDDDMEDER